MENYTVIDMATGEIRRAGASDIAQADPLGPGEGLYVGQALSSRTHYFVAGEPVAYTAAQRLAMAARPDWPARWDVATKAWVDLRTAADWRAQHRAAIDAERDRRVNADVAYDGKTLRAGAREQKKIGEQLLALGQRGRLGVPTPAALRVWRDKDSTSHAFASDALYEDWLGGLQIAIAQRGAQADAWSWGREAALVALGDDLAALVAFDPTGN